MIAKIPNKNNFEKWNIWRGIILDAKRSIDKWDLNAKDFLTIYISEDCWRIIQETPLDESIKVIGHEDYIFGIKLLVTDQKEDLKIIFRCDIEGNH